MSRRIRVVIPSQRVQTCAVGSRSRLPLCLCMLLLVSAGGTCAIWFTVRHGLHYLQTLFTGTVAKVASLIAIVIGGYGFAHGEPVQRKRWPVLLPEPALPFSLRMY